MTAGVRAGAPIALDVGQSFGPTASVAWTAGNHVRVGGRASVGLVEEFDASWAISHTELLADAVVEAFADVPPGTLFANAYAGPAWVIESRERHQAIRLSTSGAQVDDSASQLGAHGGLDLGIRLALWQGVGVSMSAGPTVVWQPNTDNRSLGAGWSGGFEVTWTP